MIYFVRCPRFGLVKIGYAKNVPKRIREVAREWRGELALLRVAPGGRPEESSFHRRFAHLRQHGEWFTYDPDMMVAVPDGFPSSIAARVIEKAGGAVKVAEICGRNPITIHKWRWPKAKGGTGGLIPAECAAMLMDAAGRGEVDLVPADFFTGWYEGCPA